MSSRPSTPEASLAKLLDPQSIAVVGASMTNERTRDMLGNLRTLGFAGPAYGVNPRYDEILGFECVASLSDLPTVPEAIAIGVATERVIDVVREAAGIGVAGAVVFAGGFADAGEEGARLERELTAVARDAGMAIIGPNCQGTVNFACRSALYSQQVHKYAHGSIALVSQSGAVTDSLSTNTRGVRWSHIVSCGNEAVVDLADLLRYFVNDEGCRGVCIFAEAIRDPQRFLAQCDRAKAEGKPVIVMRPGKTDSARQAAAAHSGALSPPERLTRAQLERHGVIQVDTLEELLSTAVAFQTSRRPKGRGVAVVAGSGGVIQLLLDASADLDLEFPALAPETQRELEGVVGPERARRNPLDIWPRAVSDPHEAYTILMSALIRDPGVHTILCQANFLTGPTGTPTRVGRIASFVAQLADATDKPIAVITGAEGQIPQPVLESALTGDVIPLSGIRSGLRALEHLAAFALDGPPPARSALADEETVRRRFEALDGEAASGLRALELVAAAGLCLAPSVAVEDEESATAAAVALGFPAVVKVGDETALHKTETGGVIVGLTGPDDVRRAARRLFNEGSSTLLVQRQVDGVELILGLEVDPEAGPFVLIGLGGIWTEVFDDVAIRPVGLREGEARQMLTELRAYPLLAGERGREPVDLDAVIHAIGCIDALGQAMGTEIRSLDVNPLMVSARGATVVDALVIPSRTSAARASPQERR